MSQSTPVADTSLAPLTTETGSKAAGPQPRTRRRFWFLLAVTLVVSALFYPPLWHVLLRGVLGRLAARHGCDLTIGRMQGGPFDTVHFYDVRWRQHGNFDSNVGTSVHVPHAELTPAWRIPWLQKPAPSGVQRLVLAGVTGRWDFAPLPITGTAAPKVVFSRFDKWLDRMASRLVPTAFYVQASDLSLQRNRYRLRLRGLRISGEREKAGLILAREVEIAGPGFANTLLNRHGQTLWQGDRLNLRELEFGPGVQLLDATLDGRHLTHQRLDWDGTLSVMGGEVRGQGAINFVRPRLALEVAGSLHKVSVAPLARLLGFVGPAGGLVEQGNFSFRGDPEDWTSAQMWLAAQATDFRWGQRDWQTLELRATVLHRRIQVHRLELQQSRNRLSLTGECPLIPPGQVVGRWWEGGFACNVDARLDDLHALTRLFGDRLPEMEGRMSINGTLETTPGRPEIDGYLNVEGSQLKVRGAPLDYLHSTLLFRGNELNVADLQATRGEDYFAGRGSLSLSGARGYQGALRVAMTDPDIYAPALAGIISLENAGFAVGGFKAPGRVETVFYGPDPEGNAVFLTFGDLRRFPGLPVPPDDDWWGENWLGLTMRPTGEMPAASTWKP